MSMIVDSTAVQNLQALRDDLQPLFNVGMILVMVGVGQVTDENFDEFAARVLLYERMFGNLLDAPLTPDDLRGLIGLKANVSFEPRANWLARVFTSFADVHKLDNVRQLHRTPADALVAAFELGHPDDLQYAYFQHKNISANILADRGCQDMPFARFYRRYVSTSGGDEVLYVCETTGGNFRAVTEEELDHLDAYLER